jgi:hypothetical protein
MWITFIFSCTCNFQNTLISHCSVRGGNMFTAELHAITDCWGWTTKQTPLAFYEAQVLIRLQCMRAACLLYMQPQIKHRESATVKTEYFNCGYFPSEIRIRSRIWLHMLTCGMVSFEITYVTYIPGIFGSNIGEGTGYPDIIISPLPHFLVSLQVAGFLQTSSEMFCIHYLYSTLSSCISLFLQSEAGLGICVH